jgi:hypothetical protein
VYVQCVLGVQYYTYMYVHLFGQTLDKTKANAYFGYSVGSGRFNGANESKILYVASAPRNEAGKVFIFDIDTSSPHKKMHAKDTLNNRSAMFGFSISRCVDIDSNEYPDIAIGSPNAEHVFVYKTYPIVSIKGHLKSSLEKLPIDNSSVVLTACGTIISRDKISKKVGKFSNNIKTKANLF